MLNLFNNGLNPEKKKINIKYLLYFLGFYMLELFATSIIAAILGYDKNLEVQNPPFLLSIVWCIGKILPLILIIFIFYKRFSECFKDIKRNFSNFLIFSFISYLAFFLITLGESFYIKLVGLDEASNQESIYELFGTSSSNINYIILFITIVILAPLLEEFEYRELLFKAFDGCHFIVPTIVSGVLFSLAHVLSVDSMEEFIQELMYFPVYFLPGFALALIYHFSNKNFLTTFVIHALSNGISFFFIMNNLEEILGA